MKERDFLNTTEIFSCQSKPTPFHLFETWRHLTTLVFRFQKLINRIKHHNKGTFQDCDCVSCSGQATALCNGTRTTCVKKEKICDGVKDCHDGEDEAQCIGQCPLQPVTKNMAKENKTVSEADNLMVTCSDGKEYSWFHACGGFNAKISDVCQNRCKKCYTATAFQCVPNQNSSTSGNESFVECIPRNMVGEFVQLFFIS